MINLNVRKIKAYLNRILLSLIIFFFICVLIDCNIVNQDIILKSGIDFSYIRSKTNILFGTVINKKDHYVTSEKIRYKHIEKYSNGFKLTVDKNYVIKPISNGVVTFIGNLDGLGKTIIINCDDGTNISYGNLENISVNLYDYISTNTIIGSTADNYLFLVFEKNKEYLSYEEYI